MNILIAANYGTPKSGNFAASILELGLKLKENGDKVYCVFPDRPNTRDENGWVAWLRREGLEVALIDLSKSQEEQLSFLKNQIKEHKIDILHIHFGMFHHFAMHNRRELNCEIIVHEHMGYPADCRKKRQSLKFVLRSAYYRLKRIGIISASKYVNRAHFLTRHWYVPNGLSMKRNVTKSKTREEQRAELGFADDEKAVLFLGWAPHIKGLDVALKAISVLRAKGENVVFAPIGLGVRPNVRKDVVDFILKNTSIDPMSEWIRYTPSAEDIFAVDRAADVLLSASRTEAFSYAILEAISQNVPVALSDIEGTDWSWKYSKAFVYPVEDANACADAILKALRIGNAPSNNAELVNKFSIEIWCDRIIDIYKRVSK